MEDAPPGAVFEGMGTPSRGRAARADRFIIKLIYVDLCNDDVSPLFRVQV